MKPAFPELADNLAARLRDEIVPELTGFRAGNVGMTAAIIDMMGEQWDGTAARLFEENDAIRALLDRGGLASGERAIDLRISALEAENARLRSAFIGLHADVEQREGDDARALERDIWAELARSVERRRVSSANF